MGTFFGKYSLVGIDGNAYSIMGYVKSVMEDEGFLNDEIDDYMRRATSGDYKNLIRVSDEFITKCNERHDEATKYDVDVKQEEYERAEDRVKSLEMQLRMAQIERDNCKKKLNHAQMFARKNE